MPSVASEVSHGVASSVLKGLAPEFVVAQMLSWPFAVLQSPPAPVAVAICVSGFVPPTHLYAVMLLTPPPLVNSDTTSTSPGVCRPVQVLWPVGAEQLASPWRNQNPTSFVPLSLFFSRPKYMILSP